MKDWLCEQKYRLVDHFYFWFGTDEYLENREPFRAYEGWVCYSVPWEVFDTYKEAEEALKAIGRDAV